MSNFIQELRSRMEEQDLEEDSPFSEKELDFFKNTSIKQIKRDLDKFVIKQDNAKKVLSTALIKHFKTILFDKSIVKYNLDETMDNLSENLSKPDYDIIKTITYDELLGDVSIPSNNILLIGDTGVGKSYILEVIAKISNLPYVRVDASNLNPEGYQGGNFSSSFKRLIEESDKCIDKARYGILHIDEIDKISDPKRNNTNTTATFYRKMIQQEILSVLQGNSIKISLTDEKITSTSETIMFPTDKLLIVLSGAFPELEEIINNNEKDNKYKGNLIGFGHKKEKKQIEIQEENLEIDQSLSKKIKTKHLEDYGLIPEFIGRINTIVKMDSLEKQDITQILTSVKNSFIDQFKLLFRLEGIKLDFENDALEAVARKAQEHKTGARGLKKILNDLLTPILYDCSEECVEKVYIKESDLGDFQYDITKQDIPVSIIVER